jgi:hypothetical protein
MESHFMSNQSEAASILCKPIGAKLWPSTSSRPTISTSINTLGAPIACYKILWSVQELRRLS